MIQTLKNPVRKRFSGLVILRIAMSEIQADALLVKIDDEASELGGAWQGVLMPVSTAGMEIACENGAGYLRIPGIPRDAGFLCHETAPGLLLAEGTGESPF